MNLKGFQSTCLCDFFFSPPFLEKIKIQVWDFARHKEIGVSRMWLLVRQHPGDQPCI